MITDIQKLRELRKEKGITLADLAEVTGLHVSAIARIESGKSDLKVSTLKRLNEGIEIILRSEETGLIMKDETQFANTAYRAIIKECEELERDHSIITNGHHLAQRLVEMLKQEFQSGGNPPAP